LDHILLAILGTSILPVILYGCENLLLTLREERRLRVFENRVIRRIFWPRRVQVNQDGLKYQLLFYADPNIVEDIKIRRLKMGGSYNKNGRRKDSKKKGSKRKLPYHKTSGKTKN
jgi:hypothetical protein